MVSRMKYQIKYKVWLEKDGDIIMGMGRDQLLREIEKQGSIAGAARKLGLSYKKAWEYIKNMEKRIGKKLVETKKGGAKGGGATLTETARELLKEFEAVVNEIENTKRKLEK